MLLAVVPLGLVAGVDLFQPRLLAGVLAPLVAWRTRNVGLTPVVGMGVVAGWQLT